MTAVYLPVHVLSILALSTKCNRLAVSVAERNVEEKGSDDLR